MSNYVYGKNSFDEAYNANRINKAYILKNSNYEEKLNKKRIPFEYVDRKTLDKMSKSGNHQGLLAEVKEFKMSNVEEMIKDNNGLIVILDGLKDPHNLGAIIRTCEGAGVDGVIYKKHNAVSVNETVFKVASGALEYVKVAEVTNINNTIEYLKKHNYWIVGSDGSGKDYYNDISYDMNTALIIGSEGEGISKLVLKNCDYIVKLPMNGKINSLNASVAAGILIYNVLDKRKKSVK